MIESLFLDVYNLGSDDVKVTTDANKRVESFHRTMD